MKLRAFMGACALMLVAGCAPQRAVAPPAGSAEGAAQPQTQPPPPPPRQHEALAPSPPLIIQQAVPPSAPPGQTPAPAAPQPGDGQNQKSQQKENPPTSATAQIVRYIGTDTSHWATSQYPYSYADLYTRFELVGPDQNGTQAGTPTTVSNLRDYDSENRSWFARLWSSETDTITTVANIEIHDPELKLSIPLFSVSHASGRDLGNTWATNFTASNVESPLFRIGPNTGLTVHLTAKVSKDLKSQGAAMVVQAVTAAVQIAAPSSSLLTTLSKSNVDNKAHAIDKAISGLLSDDISEDIELGRLADSWTPKSQFTLSGCAPFVKTEVPPQPGKGGLCAGKADLDGGQDTTVGTWYLKLACPRPSVFDVRDICHAFSATIKADKDGMIDLTNLKTVRTLISDAVSDGQIMAFNLSPNVTVQSFFQSQSWYVTFISTNTKQENDYVNLCANALLSLEANGLNKFDSLQTLRAAMRQLPQLVALGDNFSAPAAKPGSKCVKLLTDAGLNFP